MTGIYFQTCALPEGADGQMPIHMYIGVSKPTYTDNPGDERRALRDARSFVAEMFSDTSGNELIKEGEPPADGIPIFVFAIGVSWDREHNMPHYTKIDYKRIINDKRFNDVYAMCMDTYNYTFDHLRKYEKKLRDERGCCKYKVDRFTSQRMHDEMSTWFNTRLSSWVKAFEASEANKKRLTCKNCVGGFCTVAPDGTAPDLKCLCRQNGMCIEVIV